MVIIDRMGAMWANAYIRFRIGEERRIWMVLNEIRRLRRFSWRWLDLHGFLFER